MEGGCFDAVGVEVEVEVEVALMESSQPLSPHNNTLPRLSPVSLTAPSASYLSPPPS